MIQTKALLGLVLMMAGSLSPAAEDKQPSISFDNVTKDFGKVNEGEKIKHVFKFTNSGGAVLEIIKVEPS